MLRKPITYTNFNGETVTRNFYFNLTKAEIALRELTSDGTFSQAMQKIGSSSKGSEILPEFIKILKWTYGVKSADGESFIKNDEVWAQFEASEAYSTLVMELISDAGAAANFIQAIMPADLAAQAKERMAQDGFRPGAETLPQSRRDALAAEQQSPAPSAGPEYPVQPAQPVQPVQPPAIQDFGVTAPAIVPDVPFIQPPVQDTVQHTSEPRYPDAFTN